MSGDESRTPLDRVLFLARAESRVRIMEYLAESEPATQRELRTHLDVARTTVSRSLQSLVEKGWVVRDTGSFRLTRTGGVLANEFLTMLDTIQTVEDLADFLQWVPADVEIPDFHDVADLEVTNLSEADPYAPARKQTEILYTAERLRILLPATDLDSTKTITEQVTERGLEVETVVSPGVESKFESPEFAPLLRTKLQTERSTLFVARDDLPFYLGLADDGRVQIGVADEEGLPRALLETTDERVGEWAESVYHDYREQARRRSASEF